MSSLTSVQWIVLLRQITRAINGKIPIVEMKASPYFLT